MGKITFILGGARSGKSQYAVRLANKINTDKVAFIATCSPQDLEMKRRVALHKNSRPIKWRTFEEPQRVSCLLKDISNVNDIILIDCLTLLVSNLILNGHKQSAIEKEIKNILQTLKKIKASSIIVSNEVGLGIVPRNKLARQFRDIAGRMNQLVAEESDRVLFLVSGIPWRIK